MVRVSQGRGVGAAGGVGAGVGGVCVEHGECVW